MNKHWLELTREEFKFSCAHMTIFPDGTKERLHGHNYRVGVRVGLADAELANMVPFVRIKDAIRDFCKSFKEYLLIPQLSEHVEIVRDADGEIELRVCGERYVAPRQDIKLLPIANVTVECLSMYVAERLAAQLRDIQSLTSLEVSVYESAGQGATFSLSL